MRGVVFVAVAMSTAVLLAQPSRAAQRCALGNGIGHIVYIQFDNVHLRRDNPNVPSDLEQMPDLLNFLEGKGTLFTNHHTPLISHTSVDIVTSLTGVYGDKFGLTIGNSFGLFGANGVASFPSSFTYWTDTVADGLPEMLDKRGKNAPAPWVPFTRAGCDVGAFSIANIEFENISSDINNVFGANSPEAMEAANNPNKAIADFEGIIIHCAKGSSLCAENSAPDILKDEPGGYNGFTALYGNVNVQPQISPTGPVTDLDGNTIMDSHGNPGFPGFDPSPSQTLGAFDKAFGEFFARLAEDGITTENTLFIITADENDHFVGGTPSPANCDGVTTPCTYALKGEIDADLSLVYATEFGDTTPFRVHSDDAPTLYINDNPGQTDPVTRALEREAGKLLGFDIVAGANGSTNHVAQALADQAEQALLHMVTADPNRTPNFILFANPDYFLTASGKTTPLCTPASNAASCFQEQSDFAWNHGDFQNQITNTWLGMVGPGVLKEGRFGKIFSDHTDIRPTILLLAGLTDDYAHDGRVLFEALSPEALPIGLKVFPATLSALAQAYKSINAPRGKLGARTLTGISTQALKGDDATYALLEGRINTIAAERNLIAGKMIRMLESAAFRNQPINEAEAARLITQANDLLDSVP
jgi:hypothetical protein